MTEKKPHLVLVDGSLVQQRDTKLTAKQACFVRALVSTDGDGKPMSLSQAYRECYDVSRMTAKSVHERASILASQNKVRARREALEAQKDASAVRSTHSRLEFIISQLELEALGKGADSNSASRVRALELLGKLADQGGSLFQDRVQHDAPRDADAIKAELEQRLSRLLAGTAPE